MGEWADQWSSLKANPTLGHGTRGHGDAVRGRRRRRGARRAAGGRPDHHLHRLAGPAADDPQHVQDRRRAAPRLARGAAQPGRPGPVDLRRSQRRHGLPATGFAMLCSATPRSRSPWTSRSSPMRPPCARVPFIHFFDGFRTSHEVAKIEQLSDDDLRALIDDDIAAHRPARPDPRPPRHARHRPEPRRLLPGPRDGQSLLRGLPGIVQPRWTVRRLTGRRYQLFEYHGHPEAERVVVIMGSASRPPRDRRLAGREGREGGRACQGAPLPAVPRKRLPRRPAQDGEGDRRAGSHQGARLHRRAALPGCAHRPRGGSLAARIRRGSSAAATASPPRNSPRHGQAPSSTIWRSGPSPKTTSPSASSTTSPALAGLRRRLRPRGPTTCVAACSVGLGADGTVGANKNSIKIIGEETPTTRRATSSTTPRSPARSPSRTCASDPGRSAPYLIAADFVAVPSVQLRRQTRRAQLRRPGRHGPAQHPPTPPGEVWKRLPREWQQH
jgi:pyruvate-ferredoxin/flavodoxin oxidoreductase